MAPAAPAPVPGAVNTIVVLTANAASTQTQAALPPTLTPTLTPVPTRTPTQTPSPTVTFIFLLATRTHTPKPATQAPAGTPGNFTCILVNQSPADGASFSKNQSFTASWKVQNTGVSTWVASSVDFAYVSGAKLASVKLADLPKDVAPGDTVTLKLPMTAPGSANTYKTVWTLEQGKTAFCKVTLSIVVK